MTILELLTLATGVPANMLRRLIQAGSSAAPDLAEVASELLAKLDQAVDITDLAQSLPGEVLQVLKGKTAGKKHPSDLA